MFTVKKKPLTPNMIWDADNNKPLCKFVKGQLTTNDEVLATKLTELGCEVSGEADKAPDAPAADDGGKEEPEKTDPPTDGDGSSTGSEDGEPAKVETPVELPKTNAPAATTSTTGTGKRRSRK